MSDLQSRLDALAALDVFKDTTVRELCWGCNGKPHQTSPKGPWECPECADIGFTGFLGSTDVAAWLEAADTLEYSVRFKKVHSTTGDQWLVELVSYISLFICHLGQGDSPLESLVSALEKAVKHGT